MVSSSSSHLSTHDAVRSPRAAGHLSDRLRRMGSSSLPRSATAAGTRRTRGARLLVVPRCCAASCHVQLRCSVVISGRAGRLLCVRVAVHQGAKHAQARLTQLGGHRGGFHLLSGVLPSCRRQKYTVKEEDTTKSGEKTERNGKH